ncbi:MAG TPA: IPT/TIG domain-containing protein [Acidimicrobiales bacterium]|nr:IPT/TIG domain-containing protein [Acidimicrobiales bacterium]
MRPSSHRLLLALVAACLGLLVAPLPAGPAAASSPPAIAYPDLQDILPPSSIQIDHPIGAPKQLRFSHVIYNAGDGPLEVQPSFDPVTQTASAVQNLYGYDSAGNLQLVSQVPIAGRWYFDPVTAHYIFPSASYGLYAVGPNNTVGAQVAPSTKLGFCMGDSENVSTSGLGIAPIPHTPSSAQYAGGSCENASQVRGISVGWGDVYDWDCLGESIDITNVPDGTYWLRGLDDPYGYFQEKDKSNNETDVEITISGDSVTVGSVIHPNSQPPQVSVTAPSGTVSGSSVVLSASASDPRGVHSVQFLVDGNPVGSPVTTAPYQLAWDSTTVLNGAHTISAQATDQYGYTETATPVTVNVSNASQPVPSVTGLSPSLGPVRGGTTVTVTGANFLGVTRVSFGSTAATSFTVNSSTQITATSPPEAAGTVDVTVTTPGGTSATSSADRFSYQAPAPGQIYVDNSVSATGTGSVSTGSFSTTQPDLLVAFVASDGCTSSSACYIGSIGTQSATVSGGGLAWSLAQRANTLSGTAEIWVAHAPGPGTFNVTSTPAKGGFDQLLTVSALANASGIGASASAYGSAGPPGERSSLAGDPTVSVTTTRSNSWVLGVGEDAANGIADNVGRTPAAGQVLVSEWVDPYGAQTGWTQSTISPTPTGGTTVTLQDTYPNFDSWDMAAVEVLNSSSPPPSAPTVSSISPTSGPTSGGTTVTITGTNLSGASAVSFGSTAATSFTVNSSTQITATSPPEPAGTVDVTVTTPGGTSATSSADRFSYQASSPGPLSIDALATKTGKGAVSASGLSTTAPGDVLVAFVSSDGPAGIPQTATVSGAGLSWTLVKRTNSQPGTAEIWTATAPGVLSAATVTSTPSASGYDQQLTVVAFSHSSGLGASASSSASSGAPSVSLTTTAPGSWVFGVGHDWDNSIARTLGPGQVLQSQWVDTSVGDTDWVQSTTSTTASAGTLVTLNDTAPTTDRFDLAAVEVVGS